MVEEISYYHLFSSVKCQRKKRPSQKGDWGWQREHFFFLQKTQRSWLEGFWLHFSNQRKWSRLVLPVSLIFETKCDRKYKGNWNRGTRGQVTEVKMKSRSSTESHVNQTTEQKSAISQNSQQEGLRCQLHAVQSVQRQTDMYGKQRYINSRFFHISLLLVVSWSSLLI